ncbi:MAG: phospholipase/Carboxylesterase, partial [Phycisphaerales bacterium]|nr:phospholipase/Carboxylesterase [Phycisphaerales bacterium]
MPNRPALAAAAALFLAASAALAADAFPPIPRKLPPPGTAQVSATDRAALEAELGKLQKRLAAAEAASAAKPVIADLLSDVQAYEKAVRLALANDEFYEAKKPAAAGATKGAGKGAAKSDAPKPDADKPAADKPSTPRGVVAAFDLLKTANRRLDEIEAGAPSWVGKKGFVVRGYRSDVDGSAQPYGLDIPDDVDLTKPTPLYVWLHGRGDTDTDLYFIKSHETKGGEMRPKGAITLHPLGRHCVGYKSAGEIDVLDAVESVKKRYKIDANRIVLAGFSMGGAGAWHVGAHYADRWAVVHTGAGFIDVRRYQKVDPATVPAAERLMWGAYDVPDYVRNLFNVPVVSYSGELDKQRASATIMAEVFKENGRELEQFIGPGVEHKYEPKTLPVVMKRIADLLAKGRDPSPKHVELQTRTLRYNKMFWVEATGLGEHWADARVDATAKDDGTIDVTTKNVTGLTLSRPATAVKVDGAKLPVPAASNGTIRLAKTGNKWAVATDAPPAGAAAAGGKLAKRPGLQGPIDDAFMAPFLFVAPTGPAVSPAVQQWVEFEMAHQQDRWRALMRGDARVKKDTEVTPDDVAKYNLVLWGDAKSNALIAKAAEKLPAKWAGGKLAFGGRSHDAATHLPALIYPNPLNPTRYVVLNSGPTFRENDDR